jgi:outer membrane biosynthesis protein TonB
MNIEQLRKTLKVRWLEYYRENRSWLKRLGVWVNCDGKRRPSSSFILATLSTLEPQLLQMLPLIVDLSSNPDRIVLALGLNFNPDDEIAAIAELDHSSDRGVTRSLPAATATAMSEPSVASQDSTQITVPVRKIVDPPEPKLEPKPEPKLEPKLEPKPEPKVANSTWKAPTKPASKSVPQTAQADAPSRFPTLAPAKRATRRPPVDTAILSAGQLPDRTTEDLDSSTDSARI